VLRYRQRLFNFIEFRALHHRHRDERPPQGVQCPHVIREFFGLIVRRLNLGPQPI
jgi:hypothetical protein